MSFPFDLQLNNELLPNLLAILGLLMTWELHDIEVRAGRIKPRPIFKRREVPRRAVEQWCESKPEAVRRWWKSHGRIQMHILVTPNDERGCQACQQACGRVFTAAEIKKNKFNQPAITCRNPGGCRCALIGLVGNWPEAERLLRTMRESDEPVILSEPERVQLVASSGSFAGPDRQGLFLLEALHAEKSNPQFAMSRYRSLICQALEGTQHPYVVPAYLRLSDLLERGGNLAAALSVVDDFLMIVKGGVSPYPPNRLQTKTMSVRRARLLKLLQTQ